MDSLTLSPLADCPDMIEVCAAWCFGEWGCHNGGTLSRYIDHYKAAAQHTDDKTWVGMVGDKAAGMISLLRDDHPDIKHLTPWMASFYIHGDFRGKGLAGHFIRHLEDEAIKAGHKTIYLYTPHSRALYEKHGWETFDYARDPAGMCEQVALMRKIF